jgi:hypothetical protein
LTDHLPASRAKPVQSTEPSSIAFRTRHAGFCGVLAIKAGVVAVLPCDSLRHRMLLGDVHRATRQWIRRLELEGTARTLECGSQRRRAPCFGMATPSSGSTTTTRPTSTWRISSDHEPSLAATASACVVSCRRVVRMHRADRAWDDTLTHWADRRCQWAGCVWRMLGLENYVYVERDLRVSHVQIGAFGFRR